MCYVSSLKYHWDSLKATLHFCLETSYGSYCNHGPLEKFDVPLGSHSTVWSAHCNTHTCNLNPAGAAWSRPNPDFSFHRHYFCGIVSFHCLVQKHFCRRNRSNLDHRQYNQVANNSPVRWRWSVLSFLFTNANMEQIIAFRKNICLSFDMPVSCMEWNSALFIGLVCPRRLASPSVKRDNDVYSFPYVFVVLPYEHGVLNVACG